MHRLIVALLGATVLSVSSAHVATAADMPTKAPVSAPIPYYDWTGFYIGGNVGGAWANVTHTSSSTTTGVVRDTNRQNASSVIGGGQVGYNWMATPNWVLGIEADISAANLSSSHTRSNGADTASNKINDFGTVRGRLGYAWQNLMLYGTGGYAWAYDKASRTQIIGATGAATPGTVENLSKTLSGWTIGGGLEWGFARNWSAKVEYLYMNFGSAGFAFPLSLRTESYSTNVSVARVGLNYRFN